MFTKQEVLSLKKSPIYNFSLSSKELFHSNFLYWLLNDIISNENKVNDCKLFWKLICDKLKLSKEFFDYQIDISEDHILRERNNIDLRFTLISPEKTKRTVFIENKVKSIPYISQLEEYSDKALGTDFLVLLTLIDPEFLKNTNGEIALENGKIWHVLTYKDLQDILEVFNAEINITSSYRTNIIKDYILLINALVKIDQNASINIDENFDWHNNGFYKQLKDLRVADFYIKKKCTLLAKLIEEKLRTELFFKEILTTKIEWGLPNPQIQVSAGFTNGSGLVDIKYKFTQNLSVGIQIQGNQFRLVVEEDSKKNPFLKTKKNAAKDLGEKLIKKNDWFDFSVIENSDKIYPKNNGLNNYSGVFWYRYVNVPNSTSINQLVEYVIHYLMKYHDKVNYLKLL